MHPCSFLSCSNDIEEAVKWYNKAAKQSPDDKGVAGT